MTAVEIPQVWEDDCGNWWAKGHVDPPLMALAVVVQALIYGDRECAVTLLVGSDDLLSDDDRAEGRTYQDRERGMREEAAHFVAGVRHQWMRPDRDDDEASIVCEPDHPEAEAWTWMAEP